MTWASVPFRTRHAAWQRACGELLGRSRLSELQLGRGAHVMG